jgi:hypothetical protein
VKRIQRKHPTIILEPASIEDFQDFSDHYVEGESFVAKIGEQPLGVAARDQVFVFPEFHNFGCKELLYELLKS